VPIPQSYCPVCGSPKRRSLPVLNRWEGVLWHHIRCNYCGHRYTDPVPEDVQLARMYNDAYFSETGSWVCGFWSGSYHENERNLRAEARETLSFLEKKNGRLLEIGAGGGFLLDEARMAGFDVTGVELNATMAEWGRSNLGLNIITEPFESSILEPASFEVIVAQDVLEHVRDPRGFVGRVKRLLAPGGTFFVRGPLEDDTKGRVYGLLRRLPGRGPRLLDEPPYHLQGFVHRSFSHLVRDSGLVLKKFLVVPGKPTWSFNTGKTVISSGIEWICFQIDRLRGGGDFMIAHATKEPAGLNPLEALPGEQADC